ncbi:MAG: CidA/LrgA family protein [Pseudomonadota bacterium]
MTFLNGFMILLIFQLLGESISHQLELFIPGPVIGMMLLFLLLLMSRKHFISLENASGVLLSHLSLLFVPAGVGLMQHLDKMYSEWLPIFAGILLGAIISMVVSIAVMTLLIKLLKLNNHEAKDGD